MPAFFYLPGLQRRYSDSTVLTLLIYSGHGRDGDGNAQESRDNRQTSLERKRENVKKEELPEIPETAGNEKLTAILYKIAFPIISTALATVVRAVIERAIGG